MMRSMFSGVSGLRAHQTRMDVIGNNVANVNTVGFKSGRVTFSEIFNQTLRGAGAPDSTSGRGGTNPMQVGLGLGVGSVDTINTRGSVQRTDNPTDLSIEGEGFFIVKGGKSDMFRFTRAGNFGVDKLGNLVSGNGMNVYGWQKYDRGSDGTVTFDTEMDIEPINLYSDNYNLNKRMIAAQATTSSVFAGNLNATYPAIGTALNNIGTTPLTSDNTQFKAPITVYDNLGNPYQIEVKFSKCNIGQYNKADLTTANPTDTVQKPYTQWYWEVSDPKDGTSTDATGNPNTASGYIAFDEDGKIIKGGTEPYNLDTTLNGYVTDVPIYVHPSAQIGTDPFSINLDFSKVTMYSADSSVSPTDVNGYPTGNLVTFNIGSDGILTGIYSNGQQQPLGMVALAGFENPGGLQKVGDNLFIPTTNSGDFTGKGLKAGSEGVGTLSPGTLEMSNVDLSKEFTDMIITQRGFQANSRIITTSDEMLQELVNLKR